MNHVVTTYRDGSAVVKPFAWSYSKLKNFESCPKRHFHVDIKKDFKEEESEALLYGNALHKAAADLISKRVSLPPGMDALAAWIEKRNLANSQAKVLVEQKLAITKAFAPCTYFAKDAWYRGVADVIKVHGPVALAIDWKTGAIKEDSVQLGLMAACIFAHHPEVQEIKTEFIWLAHDAVTEARWKRDMVQFWRNLWPRIEALEQAHNTTTYPAKPSGLCKGWCPVTSCGYHGGNQ